MSPGTPLPQAFDERRYLGLRFAGVAGRRPRGRTRPLARTSPLPPPGSAALLRTVLRRAGLRSSRYLTGPLLRRVPECLRALRADSPQLAAQRAQRDPAATAAALDALLIGVTAFFRDGAAFESLAVRVLPELVRAVGGVRVWSAGCSDGAELYSVAMLLAEQHALERAVLLGTDVRRTALARARAGVYPAAAVAGVPAGLAARYLGAADGEVTVCPELRRAACWEQRDVLVPGAPGGWHLILCRNVSIYLERRAAAELWRRLGAALHPEGVLMVGRAERPPRERFLRDSPCFFRLRRELG